jgi:DNA modification methylase
MNAEAKRRVHPTQKPIGLMRWCIERLRLPPGSLILDPYAGSGTTALAALQLGMRCLLLECDPGHAATARRRVAEAMGSGLLAV